MKPEPIIRRVETVLRLGGQPDRVDPHYSLYENLLNDAIQAFGAGSAFYWAGDSEGYIYFTTAAGNHKEVTSLLTGADGNTNYMQLTATYTATEATVVADLYLVGTKNSRVNEHTWSIDAGVNQSLADSQDYTIFWTLHAEI